jgi:hypothetical protein
MEMRMERDANALAGIRPLLDGGKGHNYGLPDCLAFLWERLGGEPRLDFWDFAAVTGDTVAPVYSRRPTDRREHCVSGFLAGPEELARIIQRLGFFDCRYVTAEQAAANRENCLRQARESIDQGAPILVKTSINDIPGWKSDVGTYALIVGYENGGQTLHLLVGGDKPIPFDATDALPMDFIFAGPKKGQLTLEDFYFHQAIFQMAHWLALPERAGMFLGAAALRAWAEDIENGRYEDESADLWGDYGVYVRNMATSGGMPAFVFDKLAGLDGQYAAFREIGAKLKNLFPAGPDGRTQDWIKLEALGGGMNAAREVLRDQARRGEIAAVLRDRANRYDAALRVLNEDMVDAAADLMTPLFLEGRRGQSLAHDPRGLMNVMLGLSEKARKEGILALEEDLPKLEDDTLRGALRLVTEGAWPAVIRRVLERRARENPEHGTAFHALMMAGVLMLQEGVTGAAYENALESHWRGAP